MYYDIKIWIIRAFASIKNPEKKITANKTTVSVKTDATDAVETTKAVTSSKESKPAALSNEEQKLEPTKTQIERKAIADVKSAGIEKEPTLDASNPTSVEKPDTNNSDPKEEDKKTYKQCHQTDRH